MNILEIVVLLLEFFLGFFLINLCSKKPAGKQGALTFAVCLFLTAIFSLLSSNPILDNLILFRAVRVTLLVTLRVYILIFVLEYSGELRKFSWPGLGSMLIFPVLAQVFFSLYSVNGMLYYDSIPEGVKLITSPEIAWWLSIIYSSGVLVAALLILLRPGRFASPGTRKKSVRIMAFSISLALMLDGLMYIRPEAASNLDLLSAGSVLMGFGVVYWIMREVNSFEQSITRDKILEYFGDGVIVIDLSNRITDMNQAAERIIGVSRAETLGKPIEKIMSNWSSMISNNPNKEHEFKGSVNFQNQWRYFNIRIIPIKDASGMDLAKTIILRDTTDRKSILFTRQQTREELFVFLRSIFNTVGVSKSINEFLRDALYQIAYSFNIQGGAICFFKSTTGNKKNRFSLAAGHGLITDDKELLTNLHTGMDAFNWMVENKRPLVIEEVSKEPRLVEITKKYPELSIIAFPLLANDRLLGVWMLARETAPGFNPDEILRLNVIAEELASYLFKDQQNKINIALEERQRVGRDLHDSITQELSSMVIQTQAVKIGMDTGAVNDIKDAIEKISESARLALREMRLFLYELDPPNLESAGLVSALYQRIESVEKRSGVQIRLVTDDDISLPIEKETAIYYIAQEALNNILKHAHAKSVQMKIKQKKQSVVFEISDDGCGFNPVEIGQGGRGLVNMRTRAEQIGAKIKITSSPEKGTKISLTVSPP